MSPLSSTELSPSVVAATLVISRSMEPMPLEEFDDGMSLADRMPDYLATFAIGFGIMVLIGGAIWLISDIPLASTVGYAVILYGVVFLLAGGSTGGGYTNLGMAAMNSLTRTGRSNEMAQADAQRYVPTPKERLRKGLRPEANSRAFWQVIGGCLYIAIGVLIVATLG